MARHAARRERMRKVVEGWRKSGQSMRAYANRRGIDPQKLSYWRRALSVPGGVRPKAAAVPGLLVPVQVVGGAEPGVEIVLGEIRVMVREGASPALVGEVIAALRRAC
jgi:transposase-like protein